MKTSVISMIFLCLIISSTLAQAQTWSAAEKEVVQAIDDCVSAYQEENLEAFMACWHDDSVSFRYESPDTNDKADLKRIIPLAWANSDLVEWWTNPLAIRIVGDVAIIHYYHYTLTRDKDGKETRSRDRWTDVMIKQGGKWVWIADHGGADPGVKPSGN